MTLKTMKTGFRRPRRIYSTMDLDYIGNEVLISSNQRQRLIEIYNQNFYGQDDLETRISALDDITSLEASELILDFEMASWNVVR